MAVRGLHFLSRRLRHNSNHHPALFSFGYSLVGRPRLLPSPYGVPLRGSCPSCPLSGDIMTEKHLPGEGEPLTTDYHQSRAPVAPERSAEWDLERYLCG